MIIDAWAQHPTLRHTADPMFDSLRRWTKTHAPTEELPVVATLAQMDAAGVDRALISAWVAPRHVMISNDEVAGFVAESKGRFIGVGSVDISKPMSAVREIRQNPAWRDLPVVALTAQARVEDCIRHAKDTGLRRLPSREFALNQAWLVAVMLAADLVAWIRILACTGLYTETGQLTEFTVAYYLEEFSI